MQSFLQAAVIGLLTVVFANMLRKNNQELAIVLTLAACAVVGVMIFHLAEPLITFLEKLRNMTGLDKDLMSPMLKVLGIGLLTQISATICSDAGENAVAKLIETCGGILSLYIAIPLLEAVLEMMESMGGGT